MKWAAELFVWVLVAAAGGLLVGATFSAFVWLVTR